MRSANFNSGRHNGTPLTPETLALFTATNRRRGQRPAYFDIYDEGAIGGESEEESSTDGKDSPISSSSSEPSRASSPVELVFRPSSGPRMSVQAAPGQVVGRFFVGHFESSARMVPVGSTNAGEETRRGENPIVQESPHVAAPAAPAPTQLPRHILSQSSLYQAHELTEFLTSPTNAHGSLLHQRQNQQYTSPYSQRPPVQAHTMPRQQFTPAPGSIARLTSSRDFSPVAPAPAPSTARGARGARPVDLPYRPNGSTSPWPRYPSGNAETASAVVENGYHGFMQSQYRSGQPHGAPHVPGNGHTHGGYSQTQNVGSQLSGSAGYHEPPSGASNANADPNGYASGQRTIAQLYSYGPSHGSGTTVMNGYGPYTQTSPYALGQYSNPPPVASTSEASYPSLAPASSHQRGGQYPASTATAPSSQYTYSSYTQSNPGNSGGPQYMFQGLPSRESKLTPQPHAQPGYTNPYSAAVSTGHGHGAASNPSNFSTSTANNAPQAPQTPRLHHITTIHSSPTVSLITTAPPSPAPYKPKHYPPPVEYTYDPGPEDIPGSQAYYKSAAYKNIKAAKEAEKADEMDIDDSEEEPVKTTKWKKKGKGKGKGGVKKIGEGMRKVDARQRRYEARRARWMEMNVD
ncbi:hypothetical protein CC80DRAFT_549004 [Byssothecium circinans]|uniref:Uncharacterized protein n=1 Tax=Byssothecium circinans TaxID=147558 RepID=A0A6A5TTG5_9PLEO|nr:hypothetical protein CC80DRAFT_549004 [Byssothecium circinans]